MSEGPHQSIKELKELVVKERDRRVAVALKSIRALREGQFSMDHVKTVIDAQDMIDALNRALEDTK